MSFLIHGRFDHGFGWIPKPEELMQRSSTALVVDGNVWLVDPERAEGIETEIEKLGKPAGIIMTIGWHDRDVDWYAARYGIPVYGARHLRAMLPKTRVQRVDSLVPGTPFRFLDSGMTGIFSFWAEGALWWPEQGVLVTGDSIGSASYFIQPGERLALHPAVRLAPPRGLGGITPKRVFCGHGQSVHENASSALHHALRSGRSELWPAWTQAIRAGWAEGRRTRARA